MNRNSEEELPTMKKGNSVRITGQRLTGQSLSPQMAETLLQLLTEERTLRTNLEKELQDLEDELNEFKAVKQNASCGCSTLYAPIAFSASLSHDITYLGVEQEIVFDQVHLNAGDGYDARHGNFRAPVDGAYEFSVSMLARGGKWSGVEIVKNDVAMAKTRSGDSSYYTMGMNVVTLQLKAGDDVWVRHIRESDTNYLSGQGIPTFSGHLVEF